MNNDDKTKPYSDRMNDVVDYISANLDQKLTVDQLSDIANFSRFHFHRQFSTFMGISIYKFIQGLRLKKASYQLFYHRDIQITNIALEAGFENLESFSRAFKKYFSQTPSEFRKDPQWKPLSEKLSAKNAGTKKMEKVKIVNFKETKIAILKHRGPEKEKNNSIRRFIEWRKAHKFPPSQYATYNLLYDNSDQDIYRFDVATEIDREIAENNYGVINSVIPGGRCALLRHVGSWDNMAPSFKHLYGDWLPESGETLRDFPCFIHRLNLYIETPENELISDIYLPLE